MEFKLKLDKVLGAKRDLTSVFMSSKQNLRLKSKYGDDFDPQKERFKPKSALLKGQEQRSPSPFKAGGAQVGGHKKMAENLPPVWIDLQEDLDDHVFEI